MERLSLSKSQICRESNDLTRHGHPLYIRTNIYQDERPKGWHEIEWSILDFTDLQIQPTRTSNVLCEWCAFNFGEGHPPSHWRRLLA